MSVQKIFLIEDDVDIREAIIDCLKYAGYFVSSCANGQEALSYLKQHTTDPPSLMILDLMMPIMNGYEFRKAQLADARLCQIPVIVMSAGNKKTTDNNLFKGVCYISKPVDLDNLFSAIKNLLH